MENYVCIMNDKISWIGRILNGVWNGNDYECMWVSSSDVCNSKLLEFNNQFLHHITNLS